jgi:uncharacterized protein (TIGR02996 family)
VPDNPAFIRTIAASPDDDAPRLVYADYLDETGDPAKAARAEFIRVQIEKARLVPDTPRWTELWHRDTALLEWAKQWRAELPEFGEIRYGGFVRGFIDYAGCNTEAIVGQESTVFDAIPLRRLRLHVLNLQSARAVAKLPELLQITDLELSFRGAESPSNLRAFTQRGRWPMLRRISVAWLPTTGERSLSIAWRKVYAEFQGAFGDCLNADPALHNWTTSAPPRRFIP